MNNIKQELEKGQVLGQGLQDVYQSNIPFKIIQPYNLAVIMAFYSPIIITLIIISISFVFQNFKGLIYLLWLIIFVWMRNFSFEMAEMDPLIGVEGNLCGSIQYSKFGNSTFSMFFIMFSLIYFCTPMVLNNDINFWILGGFLFYLIIDIFIRINIKCIKYDNTASVLLNLILGVITGIIATTSMYATNNQKYLFFNEVVTDKDICSMPKQQTFKCAVYKNGELIKG